MKDSLVYKIHPSSDVGEVVRINAKTREILNQHNGRQVFPLQRYWRSGRNLRTSIMKSGRYKNRRPRNGTERRQCQIGYGYYNTKF